MRGNFGGGINPFVPPVPGYAAGVPVCTRRLGKDTRFEPAVKPSVPQWRAQDFVLIGNLSHLLFCPFEVQRVATLGV